MIDKRPSIRLASGNHFFFDDPAGSTYLISDVAEGISKEARFNGQTNRYTRAFSVAQHAVNASYLAPPKFAREALHHDDMEGFYKDLTTWLKKMCPDYTALLHDAERQHSRRLGLPEVMSPEVKLVDLQLLRLEKEALFVDNESDEGFAFTIGVELPDKNRLKKVDLKPWSAGIAYRRYMQRWEELG